jgi:hypothetical protein
MRPLAERIAVPSLLQREPVKEPFAVRRPMKKIWVPDLVTVVSTEVLLVVVFEPDAETSKPTWASRPVLMMGDPIVTLPSKDTDAVSCFWNSVLLVYLPVRRPE